MQNSPAFSIITEDIFFIFGGKTEGHSLTYLSAIQLSLELPQLKSYYHRDK